MLFMNNQLNYDEVVRRLQYWAEKPQSICFGPFKLLVQLLEQNRNNLYFEPKEKKDV